MGPIGAGTPQFMSLKIVRGPLDIRASETILRHYNRLTSAGIPLEEYLHWVQDGPEGPAWHVMLENDKSEIVGHSALLPLRCQFNGTGIVAGKSEYSFILEEFQSARIRGFENVGKPKNVIMVQQLFQRWQAEGLGPLLVSTSPIGQRLLTTVGCSTASFPLCECLLILKPWSAARKTPNLRRWQRATLLLAGLLQKAVWTLLLLFSRQAKEFHDIPIGQGFSNGENKSLRFFEDLPAARWRYPPSRYKQVALDGNGVEYVIVKKGSEDRYLRVCQWRLGAGYPSFQLVAKLVELARNQNAIGVRWAVYGDDERIRDVARRMRKFGFICVGRTRRLLIFSKEQEFLSADKWHLTDAMFSFDP